ncbi:LSU ribosomal protein L17P [Chitinophaga polysaccharea]|uniref:Large ribosomal subunit protein bL17 n=1 Tax=Chitinophaga polysaccharea TaxID=1293035 RepID=A0A561PH58_9BACT|nr:LSU ribosomal protein L17P [Chitinophaga polysaccharea]
MRHGVKLNKLSRTASHRKALMSNLACELISHKRITTTLAKAKALRVYVEPLLTRGKSDSTHNRRIVFSYLQDKEAIKELFGTISEKIATRPGGYTRIIKLGKRVGDNAEVALIELVDFNEIYGKTEEKAAAKKTRRAGGAKKKAAEDATETKAADTATEEKSAE